ncbi:MAG: nitronate monooxygenase [Bacteriovoracaceae bacterium]|jgi:enoyl-[acyl-carrier protein] reductase II|nr:nitronate monooxygenase [Bacteriovoracaceae bacterium]
MNKVTQILGIKYPIIQGGMVWVSGAKLAAAVSKAGGLGVIGAGSMAPDLLDQQIKKAKELTSNPIAVNLPLLYSKIEEQIKICLKNDIKILITSAGSPKKFTSYLKEQGVIVIHVTSSPLLAKKCEDAGIDIVIAEGFEAGGHNGRDEITTMCLIPQTVDAINIPVIAAGGIYDARGIKAAFALGASAVQMGTRFVMSKESSAHDNYKNLLLNANSSSTKLVMKKHVPVRLFKNRFFEEIENMETRGAQAQELIEHLGKGRAKKGMLLGDIEDGELEIGQVCSSIKKVESVEDIFKKLIIAFE